MEMATQRWRHVNRKFGLCHSPIDIRPSTTCGSECAWAGVCGSKHENQHENDKNWKFKSAIVSKGMRFTTVHGNEEMTINYWPQAEVCDWKKPSLSHDDLDSVTLPTFSRKDNRRIVMTESKFGRRMVSLQKYSASTVIYSFWYKRFRWTHRSAGRGQRYPLEVEADWSVWKMNSQQLNTEDKRIYIPQFSKM